MICNYGEVVESNKKGVEMNVFFLFVITFFISPLLQAIEQISYQFSHDPLDVVFVAHKKDIKTLYLAIDGIKQHIEHRNIIVISQEPLTDEASWFDEAQFPFTKESVAFEIFQNEDKAKEFLNHPKTRIGWIYQQLCKMYALFVIPGISENMLIVDADTIFLRPVQFQDADGAPLFNVGTEYNRPYFEHISRLMPDLKKVYEDKSGICHHMVFQKCVMEDLFTMIRSIHNEEPWKVMCRLLDQNALYGSALSEYELYFNFVCTRTDQYKIRPLKWLNLPLRSFNLQNAGDLDYVSCHNYL